MAHEMSSTDYAAYNRVPAWHGLGIVIPEDMTPEQGLIHARLNWTVEQWPLSATDGQERRTVETHVLNVRSDTREPLGVVGADWAPADNHVLAGLMSALGTEGQVKLESAGSVKSGRRVYFTARADSFQIGQDLNHRYLMLAAGHDGTLAVSAVPTSIRVVCNNTLQMALAGKTAWNFRHCGDVSGKIDELRRALQYFAKTGQAYEDAARALAAKRLSRDELMAFWTDVYSTHEKPIVATPTTKEERENRADAAEVMAKWARTFDQESAMPGYAGGSAWLAMNAVTRWYDHERAVRAQPAARAEARTYSKLWGISAAAKPAILKSALALV